MPFPVSTPQHSLRRSSLSLALRAALLGSAGVLAGLSTTAAYADVAHHYDIPAASLEDALSRFAAQAGITLPFDPVLVQGQQAPALKGDYQVGEALQIILQGSSLSAQQNANGTWTLTPRSSASGSLELSAMSISGKAPGALTESTGSYSTYSSSSSTRLNLSPRETPQSLTVITRQRLDDQRLDTLTDVMDATPGISVNHASVGSENNRYWSRGFMINNFEIDGIPVSSRLDNSGTSSAMFDRVEIVRGATGLISGTGTPAATINLIRKRPTHESRASLSAEAGSWDHYGLGLDVSGPLTETGNARGRLVIEYKDQGSWIDWLQQDSALMYGISEFDLSDSTLLTTGFSYQKSHSDSPLRVGFPAYFSNGQKTDFSRSTNSSPKWTYYDRTHTSLFVALEQQFANGWNGKLEASHSQNEFDQLANYLAGEIDQNSGAGAYLYPARWSGTPRQNTLDGYLSGPFSLFGQEHELITGVTLSSYSENVPDRGGWYGPWTGYDGTLDNFFTWDGNGNRPDTTPTGKTYIQENQYAAYATARLHLTDSTSLILGTRVTDWKRDNEYRPYEGDGSRNVENRHGIVLPYAGLVQNLDETWSVYASYTQIFNPQQYGMKSVGGGTLEPQEGTGYEMGIKGSFNDDSLIASLALFRLEQDNLAVSTGLMDIYTLEQGTSTEGVELELNGSLSENWQLSTGYAYSVSNDSDDQRIVTNIPRHSLKTFTSYRLPGQWEKLTLGGGVNWQSKVGENLHAYTQGSYALVNLMARYAITENLSATLNVDNLLDRKYAAYADTWVVYGEPRSITSGLKYDF